MRRFPELLVAALAAAAALVWFLALLTSRPPPLPVIVVQGESVIARGMPWALRFSAVSSSSRSQLPVEGEVRLAGARAPIIDGTARIAAATAGSAELELTVGGVPLHGTVDVFEGAVSQADLTWSPWWREVVLDVAGGGTGARDPVYPLDGRVSARLPSRVLILQETGAKVLDIAPQAQGATLSDGRVLAVDRTGLRVVLPLVVGDVVVAQVLSAEPRRVSCDLLVDAAVHDVVSVDVHGTATVRLRAGSAVPAAVGAVTSSAAAPALVVVHCGGVWPDEQGRSALAFRIAGAEGSASVAMDQRTGEWARSLALAAGASLKDPLLRSLLQEDQAVRALLGRLAAAKLRAGKLAIVWRADRLPGASLRCFFAGLASLVVVATLVLGFTRLRDRRWSVLVSALVLAVLLAGMYVALIIDAS